MEIPIPAWLVHVPVEDRKAAMTQFRSRLRRVWNYSEPRYDAEKQEFILPLVLRNPRDRTLCQQRSRLLLQTAACYHNEYGHMTALSMDCGKSLRTLSAYASTMDYIPGPVCIALERMLGRHIMSKEMLNPKAFGPKGTPRVLIRAAQIEAEARARAEARILAEAAALRTEDAL